MSNPYEGDSNIANTPGIKGTNTATGLTLPGEVLYVGVWGTSKAGDGVRGEGFTGVVGVGNNAAAGRGVSGTCNGAGAGVYGGNAGSGAGVWGTSGGGDGVHGESESNQHAGVSGVNDSGGFGVWARGSPAGHFEGSNGVCVEANGTAAGYDAIVGTTTSGQHAAIAGHNNGGGFAFWGASDMQNGIGIYARGQKQAAQFDGAINCNGDINSGGNINMSGGLLNLTNGADVQLSDCAEEFEVASAEEAEPGTVMMIDDVGVLKPAERAYDKRVAGIISGAGSSRPAIVLNRRSAKPDRAPVALFGAVYCKVDCQYGPIEVGDLLTTSATRGHAMKAMDPLKAFGAVLGKALRALDAGKGLIPVLVSLQ